MSKVVKHRWISDFSGPSKPDRRSCEYEAYVPDGLLTRRFGLDGDVAAEVADAEASIARLNVSGASLVNTEALARILLHAEVARGLDDAPSDVTATEVLGNIDAMIYGIEGIGLGDEIAEALLLEIHRRLLVGTRLEEHGGHYRDVQNWIGGSSYNPCSASFVPPPPEN